MSEVKVKDLKDIDFNKVFLRKKCIIIKAKMQNSN